MSELQHPRQATRISTSENPFIDLQEQLMFLLPYLGKQERNEQLTTTDKQFIRRCEARAIKLVHALALSLTSREKNTENKRTLRECRTVRTRAGENRNVLGSKEEPEKTELSVTVPVSPPLHNCTGGTSTNGSESHRRRNGDHAVSTRREKSPALQGDDHENKANRL
jgi:hypothetical protein